MISEANGAVLGCSSSQGSDDGGSCHGGHWHQGLIPSSVHRTRTRPLIHRTSVQTCRTSVQVPGTWYQAAGTDSRYLMPGLVPGAWYQVPGTWYQVPGTRYLVSDTGYLVPGTAPAQAFKYSEHRTPNPNTEQSE